MIPEPARDRAPKLPPAYRLVQLDEVDSTNSEAKRRAAEGAEDGTLIWARRQTASYGRHARQWDSAEGNLFLSLVTRPECSLAEAAQLSFLTALALGDAVGSVAPPMIEVTYKWPNDVLFNGRKGAGILLESKGNDGGGLEWLVVGVGVNVNSYPTVTRFPATSLHFEGCPASLSAVDVLEAFSRHLLTRINAWLEDGFAPARQAWPTHAHGLSEEIEVRLPTGTLRGRFEGLDPQGALQLLLPDGRRRSVAAGDVYFPGAG